ncbi:hypothetical protein BH11PSE8_BH11PSE8_31030 [soil metagenome]
MDPTTRLRIATRIHFALLRHFGEDVGIQALLDGNANAREALWVCEACGVAELVILARQFNHAQALDLALRTRSEKLRPDHPARRLAAEPDWASTTGSFAHSRPSDLGEGAHGRSGGAGMSTDADADTDGGDDEILVPASGWLNPGSWLRAGAARKLR